VSALAATWAIAALATSGVILRPWRLQEAVWALAGAALLVVLGLLPLGAAWRGIAKGADVYLLLTGMMLLAEVARKEGLFDWLAALRRDGVQVGAWSFLKLGMVVMPPALILALAALPLVG